jgi:hypothetical protein
MARADIFVFLDDVQFSKGSYTNRVRIADAQGRPQWLTIPIHQKLGTAIQEVSIANADWPAMHLRILFSSYRVAPQFPSVWPDVEEWLTAEQVGTLSLVNERLLRSVAAKLEISPQMTRSSALGLPGAEADRRLAAIVSSMAPNGTYLSGTGGAKYQSEEVFAAANVRVAYSDFTHPVYPRGGTQSEPGLSVLDAAFYLGWKATAALVTPARRLTP